MSIFQVFDKSSSFWWLIHFYSDDTANFGCYVIMKFTYLLFRRARRALFSDVFTDTAKMPSPIWEVGRTKKEVVRFNQGGYICPAHNYEPRRRRIGLRTDGSAVSGCASQQVYISQLFERTLQSYKAVPDVSDRTWAAWSTVSTPQEKSRRWLLLHYRHDDSQPRHTSCRYDRELGCH